MRVANGLLALAVALLCAVAVAGQVATPADSQSSHDAGINWETIQASASPSLADVSVTPPSSLLQQQQQAAQPKGPQSHHIFFVIPAYQVSYTRQVPPLSPHEKLTEMLQETYDPLGLAASAGEAYFFEHDPEGGFCGYGKGHWSYMKCYGSALADANVSGVLGDWLFPVWFKQDPRYFRLGQGSFGARLFYALSRTFITDNDKGQTVFDSSQLLGTTLAGVISNAYYPKTDRGVGLTMSRIAFDLTGTAIFNVEAEFWQDVDQKLFHHQSH